MTICIPIEQRPEGGLFTFLGNFTAFLQRAGVPCTRDLKADYDVLFTNSWVVPFATVRSAKRRRPGIRVVQRVDGSAQDYGRGGNADELQARVNLLADLTIFQSEFARRSVRTRFKVIAQDGPVIHNAVDVDRFCPAISPRAAGGRRPRLVNVTWSTNPLKGAARLRRLIGAHPEVDFVLCGRHDAELDGPHVARLGTISHDRLPEVLRSCDAFLHLAENESCPNVILEALASGLPVLYIDSGAAGELVGPCGAPIEEATFSETLARVLATRDDLAAAARHRAESLFSPDAVFPRYLAAIHGAARRPEPDAAEIRALAAAGFPVLSSEPHRVVRAARGVARRAKRTLAGIVSATLAPRRPASAGIRYVGWVTYDSFKPPKRRFRDLHSFTRLRAGNVADWINAQGRLLHNELYRPGERYDIVVFQKRMDVECQEEAQRIQHRGGKVVFDANVNYYDVWGDYFIPGTLPTEGQQRDAIAMTTAADWVVADSTYVAGIVRRFTQRVTWIPDAVDLSVYGRRRQHAAHSPVRMIWSGVAKKAAHLLLIRDVLAELEDAELVLVSDGRPDCFDELASAIPCHVRPFSDEGYADALQAADIVISPKRLVNGYEMGHTEYKIALGMAAAVPAVASPQQSYVDAVGYAGGGIIASTPDEWLAALTLLTADPAERQRVGDLAARTVRERYSTPVIASQFLSLFEALLVGASHAAAVEHTTEARPSA